MTHVKECVIAGGRTAGKGSSLLIRNRSRNRNCKIRSESNKFRKPSIYRETKLLEVVAQIVSTFKALSTIVARDAVVDDDSIAFLKLARIRSHIDHLPRDFVAQGQCLSQNRDHAVKKVEFCVAN